MAPLHVSAPAQVGFLTCLREFADWLVARGASDGAGNRFALPCPIEGDKVRGGRVGLVRALAGGGSCAGQCALVRAASSCCPLPRHPTRTAWTNPPTRRQVNGLTIRLLLNKDKNWTRALKHMLVDLKFVLKVERWHEGGGPHHPSCRQDGGCQLACMCLGCTADGRTVYRQVTNRPPAPLSTHPRFFKFALVLLDRASDGRGGGGGHQPMAALQREDFAGSAAAAAGPGSSSAAGGPRGGGGI